MNVNRRTFAKQSSAGVFSTWLMGHPLCDAEIPDITNQRLLRLGLNALARSHQFDYFADGHRGASLVAAHLLCIGQGLDDAAESRIVELFEHNWASGPLCAPFPDTEPQPDAVAKIGEALMDGSGVLRQVGHDAIFAMLAIKGFRMLPSAATPERIDGVCKLIRSFTPWRDIDPDPAIEVPPLTDAQAMSRFVLKETSEAIDRFIGFGQGFAGHMMTFGQALVELAAMGDVEWAESCRVAFHKYVTVTRMGPQPGDRRIPEHRPSPLRPDEAEYWQQRGDKTLGIGHVFKYPYGYYELIRHAQDAKLAATLDAKAWHVF